MLFDLINSNFISIDDVSVLVQVSRVIQLSKIVNTLPIPMTSLLPTNRNLICDLELK